MCLDQSGGKDPLVSIQQEEGLLRGPLSFPSSTPTTKKGDCLLLFPSEWPSGRFYYIQTFQVPIHLGSYPLVAVVVATVAVISTWAMTKPDEVLLGIASTLASKGHVMQREAEDPAAENALIELKVHTTHQLRILGAPLRFGVRCHISIRVPPSDRSAHCGMPIRPLALAPTARAKH